MLRLWRAKREEVQKMLDQHDLVFGDADNLDLGKDAEWPAQD